ncbi:hypothetical protein [Lysinibacillus sp. RC79]|uniref:hypothetical protein n=1 Tax=Lysinibacillus sp. RC79 TaxID=3156296 RepID=UPI0035153F18
MTKNPYDYYITDDDYAIAKRNGISRECVNDRIRGRGWSKERALNTPVQKKNRFSREILEKAKSNDIQLQTFRERVRRGWDIESAATVPPIPREERVKRSVSTRRVYPVEIINLADSNGISYGTFKNRVKKLGWDITTAATKPIMTKQEALASARKKSSFHMGVEIFWNTKQKKKPL